MESVKIIAMLKLATMIRKIVFSQMINSVPLDVLGKFLEMGYARQNVMFRLVSMTMKIVLCLPLNVALVALLINLGMVFAMKIVIIFSAIMIIMIVMTSILMKTIVVRAAPGQF